MGINYAYVHVVAIIIPENPYSQVEMTLFSVVPYIYTPRNKTHWL